MRCVCYVCVVAVVRFRVWFVCVLRVLAVLTVVGLEWRFVGVGEGVRLFGGVAIK